MTLPDSKKDQTARHVAILQESYRHYTGRYLFDPKLGASEAIVWLEQAPFALVSHGTSLIRFSIMVTRLPCNCSV